MLPVFANNDQKSHDGQHGAHWLHTHQPKMFHEISYLFDIRQPQNLVPKMAHREYPSMLWCAKRALQ